MPYGTVIVSCTCDYKPQDALYGKGKRVYNITKSGNGRCTVCSKMKNGVGIAAITIMGKEIK